MRARPLLLLALVSVCCSLFDRYVVVVVANAIAIA